MRRALILLISLSATACSGDETLRAYGGADKVWTLMELDGIPFDARATLTFPKPGQMAGHAPCNRYTGTMTAPYPWFEAGPLAATRMACPDLIAETAYFEALGAMITSEVAGDTLILGTGDGRRMVFISDG